MQRPRMVNAPLYIEKDQLSTCIYKKFKVKEKYKLNVQLSSVLREEQAFQLELKESFKSARIGDLRGKWALNAQNLQREV